MTSNSSSETSEVLSRKWNLSVPAQKQLFYTSLIHAIAEDRERREREEFLSNSANTLSMG